MKWPVSPGRKARDMSKLTDVIAVFWPTGIPPSDYGKVVEVVKAATNGSPAPERKEQPRKATKKRGSGYSVGSEAISKVVAALSTGPATAREVADATGLHYVSVYGAIRKIGAVTAGEAPREGGGLGKKPAVFALPSRTP